MNDATARAVERLLAAVPVWTETGTAGERIGLDRRTLLHAGPPFANPEEICPPVLNAAAAALLFEGMAEGVEEARALVRSGAVTLRPAQDLGVVTPLAAVVSRSMWLHVVEDAGGSGVRAHSPLNEGGGPALRFGIVNGAVVERLRLLHGAVGPTLAGVGPVELSGIAREAMEQGDELHGRVGVASALLTDTLASRLGGSGEVCGFLREAGQFFLNPWMAACKTMLLAADGVPGAALVTAAGGNGVRFGLRLSGMMGEGWASAPAAAPQGPDIALPGGAPRPRLPAIGDSAVIDAVGFGALALDAAPLLRAELGAAAGAAIAAGGGLFGLMGMVLATPFAVVLLVLVNMLYIEDKLGKGGTSPARTRRRAGDQTTSAPALA
ncbi:YlbE family protein, partial [Azospirillum isscasi]